ncbi:motility associated factor glycosyltransferase family protein [Sporosarcina newyorkensis]|uniref:motility associated factor glycosyltransferase family protein n=1 Tax=Sporosarcina newyorkensis TaxID=759851 RepID=UPI003CFE360C
MRLSIIETKTVPTIQVEAYGKKFIFHSKYNPLHEAKVWVEKETKYLKDLENIIVIGVGAGYHIQQLAERFPKHKITVIEFNDTLFDWFRKSPFYGNINPYKNVKLQQFNQLSTTEQTQIFSSVSSTNLLIHKSGLDVLPQRYGGIKSILDDIQVQKSSILNQIDNMNKNFEKNILLNDSGIAMIKNKYEGKPMILISAGPSLDKQLPFLKKIQNENRFIMGAVGTAVKPLLKFGIMPDFFSIIDPNKATFNQLTDLNLQDTPLFYLCTAYHDTILLHTGPRRILYQEGFSEAEKRASKKNEPLIQTGGSVATALLDVMVYLGGQSIALVGQDLAYTYGKSHTTQAHAQKEIKATVKTVDYYQTGQVYTGKNLNIYRKWFENYAKSNSHIQLFNCTEGGAYIQHLDHISLEEYYLKYK